MINSKNKIHQGGGGGGKKNMTLPKGFFFKNFLFLQV